MRWRQPLSEFKGSNSPATGDDATRAIARLPGLDIEIVHRRLPSADSEQLLITLQATLSFEAFGQFLRLANPLTFWAEAARLAYAPWLEAARGAMLALTPPSTEGRSDVAAPGLDDRHS